MDCESLCRKFDASESTIRRDLMGLEEQGVLRRVHGGAISLLARDETLDLARLGPVHKKKKGALARPRRRWWKMARPSSQIFRDCKNVEVTLTGGYLYPRSGVLMGPICEEGLSHVAADLLILGLAAISHNGLSKRIA